MKRILKIFAACLLACACLTACDDTDTSSNDDNNLSVTKYSVQIEVKCESNLLFSRYDIEVFVDDVSQGIIEHGQSNVYELSLEEGIHELSINKEGDSSVDGYVNFDVDKEGVFKYTVHCTNDQVEIEEYVENENGETDDQNTNNDTDVSDNSHSTNDDSNNTTDDVSSKENVNLTIDNCEDLKTLLIDKKEDYQLYASFAKKYKGKVIEFDGSIDNVMLHGNYDTRYDLLLTAGDFSTTSVRGPSFKFEDVNYYDLDLSFDDINLNKLTGKNVHIVAEVEEFNSNNCLFFLDPVSVTVK